MKKILILILLINSCSKKLTQNLKIENKDLTEQIIKAIMTNDLETLNILINIKNVNDTYSGNRIWHPSCITRTIYIQTPLLIIAIAQNYKEAVELLLNKGANINIKNKWGNSALIVACYRGRKEIAELLINRGANLNEKGEYGNTALICAAHKGYETIVKLLLDSGASIEEVGLDNNTALLSASKKGNYGVVKLLLDRGANINAKDKWDNTALICASYNGNKEIAELLINRGANLNEKGEYDNTALMCAVYKGYIEIVNLLLESGANIHEKNNKGNEALDLAKVKNNKGIIELIEKILIIEEIFNDVRNKNINNSLLKINSQKNRIFNKINFNHSDKEGNTFLHYAAMRDSEELILLLLECKVDINKLNKLGQSPLYMAIDKDNINENIVKLLINEGADLKPKSYARGKAMIDVLRPYEYLCNKLVYEPLTLKLVGNNNYIVNKNMIKEIIKIIKLKDDDFDQDKYMIDFIKNVLIKDVNSTSLSDTDIPEEDLEDVDLNIEAFKAIFDNFTISDYWDEIKANLQYNIDTFMERLVDIKNASPVPKPNIKSSAKDKAIYMTFKAKKQLHKLLGYISLTAERGKNNDKIVFAINQILAELVCRGGSLEAIDLAVNTFTGESSNELKHDISILLLNLRKQMLKEAARGKCYVTYYDPIEGRNIKAVVEPEDPHLLIHLCNIFSNELKLPVHVDEHNFNYEYDKNVIINEYNYKVDKIIEYMIAQIDPTHNIALWNKVKDYIERNIFKGRPIFQIDNFIYDDEYKMKKEAIIALLIHFGYLK